MKIITVTENNIRLDRYIRMLVPHVKQSTIEKSLRLCLIMIENQKVQSNTRVQIGQKLSIKNYDTLFTSQDDPQRFKYDQKLIDLIRCSVLYEDDDLIIINKPPGIAVQGGSKVSISIDHVLNAIKPGETLRIVHRLDKDTSGVLLLARNVQCARFLMESFKNHGISKTYLAITERSPKKNSDIIKQAISKSYISGEEKMCIDSSSDGKVAITKFSVLHRNIDGTAVLKLNPITGRKHQLRVHLAHIGCPILGDRKYGNRSSSGLLQLHSYKISLISPLAKKIEVIAPLPKTMDIIDASKFIDI